MPSAALFSLRREPLGKIEAIACEVVRRAMHAFLQYAAGIEGSADGLRVSLDRLFLLRLEVRGQTPQPIHLVTHLAGGDLSGAAEALIERPHPLEQRRQLAVERVAGCSQFALALNGHRACSQ